MLCFGCELFDFGLGFCDSDVISISFFKLFEPLIELKIRLIRIGIARSKDGQDIEGF